MAVKLSQTDKYVTQAMLQEKKTPEEIADFIKKPLKLVTKYIEVELNSLHDTIVKAQLEDAAKPTGIITTTSSGKSGVSIMTQAASDLGDNFLKNAKRKSGRTSKGNLYNLKGEKIE